MTDPKPKRIYLGAFEGGTRNLIIPAEALRRADGVFDRERDARLKSAASAKLQAMQAARSRARLKRTLKLVFGRRGR